MKYNKIIISFFLFILFPHLVSAASAKMNIEGNTEFYKEQSFSMNISLTDIKENNLMSAGGKIIVTDPDCVEFVSLEKAFQGVFTNNNIFAYSDIDGIKEDTSMVKINLRAKQKSCKTTIQITEPKIAFTDGTKLALETIQKEVMVLNIDEIKINQLKVLLGKNETTTLNLYTPAFQINSHLITWKSQNNQIASVDETGNVKGLQKGNTIIESNYQGKQFFTEVEVLEFLRGDLNRDGRIDLTDVLLALRIQMNLTPSSNYYLETGDINGNKVIDLTDVLYILRVQMKI